MSHHELLVVVLVIVLIIVFVSIIKKNKNVWSMLGMGGSNKCGNHESEPEVAKVFYYESPAEQGNLCDMTTPPARIMPRPTKPMDNAVFWKSEVGEADDSIFEVDSRKYGRANAALEGYEKAGITAGNGCKLGFSSDRSHGTYN